MIGGVVKKEMGLKCWGRKLYLSKSILSLQTTDIAGSS